MQIPKENLESWLSLKSQGDYKKIAEIAKCDPRTVKTAFSSGKCSDELFIQIKRFYSKKESKLKAA